jgi:hypothetical protein
MPKSFLSATIRRVSPSSDERLGKNEAIFRDVNERIEAGQLPADADQRVAFCCECARLGCNQLIEITIGEYERVRAHPRRFVLAVGHELDGIEKIVETASDHIVIEKIGDAGEAAQDNDPRARNPGT